jgi:DNA-binding NarL/FixJ family response regulator
MSAPTSPTRCSTGGASQRSRTGARQGFYADLAHRARLSDSRSGALVVAGIPEPLTAREVDVLELLARGNTNREIGERLFISEHTVAAHVSHLLGKIGARSRVDLVARAARLGLLAPQTDVEPSGEPEPGETQRDAGGR